MTFPHTSLHCKLVPFQYQEYKYDLLKLERSSSTSLIIFSVSDNAILAFWLVHCITVSWLPAIIPAFDLIWKLMQWMSLGIKNVKFRWHKIDKKEKTDPVKRNTRNNLQCRPSNNKKAVTCKFGIRLFNGTYPFIISDSAFYWSK